MNPNDPMQPSQGGVDPMTQQPAAAAPVMPAEPMAPVEPAAPVAQPDTYTGGVTPAMPAASQPADVVEVPLAPVANEAPMMPAAETPAPAAPLGGMPGGVTPTDGTQSGS